MTRHKHNWDNVLHTVMSTDPTQLMDIDRCQECQSVRIFYGDINRTVIINKPKR